MVLRGLNEMFGSKTSEPFPAENNNVTTDDLWDLLRQEALDALQEEPELEMLLKQTVLAPTAKSFEDAVAATVCYRLLLNSDKSSASREVFSAETLLCILSEAMSNDEQLEYGHAMSEAVRKDALAVLKRDPACETLLEVVLFMKGFAALVCHRAARQKWYSSKRRSMTALFLQSQASAMFAVDIHPAATMGAGIMLDHGTGIVIGETAVVGDGCTILHGVTLGGTGKETGQRHPKVGDNVLLGAGSSVLGNIRIGKSAKVGAGSIVLRDLPPGATAVGAPAKIIGKVVEQNPADSVDEGLKRVSLLHKSRSMEIDSSTTATASLSENSISDLDDEEEQKVNFSDCPFREYKNMAKTSPPGSVTICSFYGALKSTGIDRFEIYSAFFELDVKNVGHVYWNQDTQERARICLLNITSLSPGQVDQIIQDFQV